MEMEEIRNWMFPGPFDEHEYTLIAEFRFGKYFRSRAQLLKLRLEPPNIQNLNVRRHKYESPTASATMNKLVRANPNPFIKTRFYRACYPLPKS